MEYGKQPPKTTSVNQIELTSFVGSKSMGFFRALHLDFSFLQQSSEDWPTIDSYQKAHSVVTNIQVVNDSAERGVKLGHDFLNGAKTESRYQNLLQVVENDRKRVGNQRKLGSESKTWFLTL